MEHHMTEIALLARGIGSAMLVCGIGLTFVGILLLAKF